MSSTTTTICAFCHVAVEADESTACSVCGTRHHTDCFEQNEGCAVALCEGGPRLPYMPQEDDVAGVEPVRRVIDVDDDHADSRRGLPGARWTWTRGRIVVLVVALIAIVVLVVLAARGPATSPTLAAGGDTAQAQAPSDATRPHPGLTAKRIATEKRRVKAYMKLVSRRQQAAAATARKKQQAAALAAANARTTGAGTQSSTTRQTPATPPTPRTSPKHVASGGKTPTKSGGTKKKPRTQQAKPVTADFE
jgi:hypothetical protein